MSIEDDDTNVNPAAVESDEDEFSGAPDLSWMEQVRAERDARLEDESLMLGVPTWGPEDEPDLAFKFGVVERRELENYARAARRIERKKGAGASALDMDFLIKAVRAVYVRSPEDHKLVKVVKDGRDIRIEKVLAEMLGVGSEPDGPGKDSHALLGYLIKNNSIAIGALAMKVATWMQNTSADIEGALLGE